MDYLLIGIVTMIGAALTLFSGFGLGTLLLPVFGLFFPVELAIALTAIVHFMNNLIKLGFFIRFIDWKIAFQFGIPSVLAAFLGAHLLTALSGLQSITEYSVSGNSFEVSPVKLTIAVLLAVFSLFEIIPRFAGFQFDRKYMPVGGLLSGFFGGLSGNQGALRTAFLIRAGLSKESFIATGVVIACFIDITRLSIYSGYLSGHLDSSKFTLIGFAVICAFSGVYFGNRLVKKITVKSLQKIVAVMILLFALLLGVGII